MNDPDKGGRHHDQDNSSRLGHPHHPPLTPTLADAVNPTDAPPAHHDLTDLPPDLLALILPHLQPGHRLDLRAVCRRWADWADGPLLSTAAQLNIVCDARELRRALSSPHPRPRSQPPVLLIEGRDGRGAGAGASGGLARGCEVVVPSGGAGGAGGVECGAAASPPGGGLLTARFHKARVVRLWVGCRPPVPLAGHNGGGAAANAVAAAAAAAANHRQRSRCLDPLSRGGSGGAGCFCGSAAADLLSCGLSDTVSLMLTSASASVTGAGAVLRRRLADAGYTALRAAAHALLPRQPPLLPPPPRPQPRSYNITWHAHSQQGGGGAAGAPSCKLLRRYAPEPAEASMPPLPACLPLLGTSERLTHLSIVTASGRMDPQELEQLGAAFPNLQALALHAHQCPGMDAHTLVLPSLAPLAAPPSPPSPSASASASPAPSPSPSPARVGPEREGPGCQSRPSPSPAPAPSPSPSPVPSSAGFLQLRSLVLSGVRCEWPSWSGGVGSAGSEGPGPGPGLASLVCLRSLVLHRTVGRMHVLLPQIRALTQLTRLELLRLDFHHSVPLLAEADQGGRWERELLRELERKAAAEAEAAERRRQRRRQRRRRHRSALRGDEQEEEEDGRPPQPPFSPAQRSNGHPDTGDEAEEDKNEEWDSDDEWDSEEEEGGQGAGGGGGGGGGAVRPWPPLLLLPARRRRWQDALPDWPGTMAALGRAVRRLAGLRVLACDVEPPERWDRGSPWARFLPALSRLSNLESLALPALPLSSDAQARRLAAALPRLTSLELGSLPPAAAATGTGPNAALRGSGGGDGGGGGGPSVPPACVRALPPSLRSAAGLRRHYLQCHQRRGGTGGAGVNGDSEGGGRSASGEDGAGVAGSSGNSGGGGSGRRASGGGEGSGCLSCFRRLRRLTLRHASVAQLAQHGLPLPPGLRELSVPLEHGCGHGMGAELALEDLALLHSRLLPALRPLASLALAPRPCWVAEENEAGADEEEQRQNENEIGAGAGPGVRPVLRSCGPLVVLMLGGWLGGCLTELDLRFLTHPAAICRSAGAAGTGGDYVAECLRHIADGMPQLRRLSCCLTLGPTGALQPPGRGPPGGGGTPAGAGAGPEAAAGGGAAVAAACAQRAGRAFFGAPGGSSACRGRGVGDRGCGGSGGSGGSERTALPSLVRAFSRGADLAVGGQVLEHLNAMQRLEELRLKVFAEVQGSVRVSPYTTSRVPLGLLRGLLRPLRVVDCSPLECWCSPVGDGGGPPSADPRVALSAARAALAASGCRCCLVSEAEEWAAGATGLGPEREAAWRSDALLG